MKKSIRFLAAALKVREERLPDAVTGQNDETLVIFEEQEKKTHEDGKGLCAFSLFNVFTADIIQQNTLFTR
jgi:hypothetical protein